MAEGLRKGKQKPSRLASLAALTQLVAPMSATVGDPVLGSLRCSQTEVELMAKGPSDPSLFPWGFQRGQVPQASPSAVKPPLRPHPKPSNGTQGNQIGGSKPEGQ